MNTGQKRNARGQTREREQKRKKNPTTTNQKPCKIKHKKDKTNKYTE